MSRSACVGRAMVTEVIPPGSTASGHGGPWGKRGNVGESVPGTRFHIHHFIGFTNQPNEAVALILQVRELRT